MSSIQGWYARLEQAWGGSIRRRLVWSFSLVSMAIILGSGLLLYSLQRDFLYAQGNRSAIDLARTLSFSGASWVLANDSAGLQEVLKGASEATDLKFAIVLSPQGEILASTRPAYIGQFFSDAPSQRLLGLPPKPQILLDQSDLIDVAVPIQSGDRHIGWVRVELTRDTANANLRRNAAVGAGIATCLLLMIAVIATKLARGLTTGLHRLARVADDAEHGRAFQREDTERADEIGVLARHLYRSLDSIDEEKRAKIESETRFRRLVQVAPIPLAYLSKSGVIEHFNDRFATLFGYTHEDIPTIEAWWRHAYPDEAYRQWVIATWSAAVQAASESGQDIQPSEYRVARKNGEVRIMEISGVLLGDDVLATFIDLTARKQAEEALRASLREKESLLKEVHHRVKNNLQVITSLLRLEAGRSTQPDTKSVLKDMQNRIRSMALLHESLYRAENLEQVNLPDYITQVTTHLYRSMAVERGKIQLHLDLAPMSIALEQAVPCGLLVNELVSNCLKHGFPDGRSGEIRIELQAGSGGPQVRLRVSDTGVGLPPDFEEKRACSLGMQLVADLARQLKGQLEIGGGPGVGAVFEVAFTPKGWTGIEN
ncbi:MAG: PAS domain S-box protein [Holophagaceae bacterium]|nr:PAS domain S-box protein [Holophagaceae bacterium]